MLPASSAYLYTITALPYIELGTGASEYAYHRVNCHDRWTIDGPPRTLLFTHAVWRGRRTVCRCARNASSIFRACPLTVPESRPRSRVVPHRHSAVTTRQSVLLTTTGSCFAIGQRLRPRPLLHKALAVSLNAWTQKMGDGFPLRLKPGARPGMPACRLPGSPGYWASLGLRRHLCQPRLQ